MSGALAGFDGLAPIVQHHIVNELMWPGLRPVQAQTVRPILDGENLIVVAPTAGGKTEAAFFPLLSAVHTRRWRGLSVLYLSPIRALLNNQVDRLRRYFGWVGGTVAVWHGDIGASARKRVRKQPPNCLLTTPESIESMLCSRLTEAHLLFADLQAVVIDEVHGFADGDRGWHLLAVLERLSALAGRDLQRIALSATVANLDELRDWQCGTSARARRTIAPAPTTRVQPQVRIDRVEGLEDAAKLISLLHRGEKRLVFTDSRLQCERLAAALRARDIVTFVTHSSLSVDERKHAERAFATAHNCVIVATSALELGIDIGDLDRVIQLDAPSTVASFLQRMGRTGRRAGTTPNCLFICTSDMHLLRAAAVVGSWQTGFVEDARCPPAPWHLVVQQGLATLLQYGSRPERAWRRFMVQTAALFDLPTDLVDPLVDHLLAEGWVAESDGRVHVGDLAEARLGRRHFLELLSVFSTPPFYVVQHGRQAIGSVHEQSFWRREGQPVLVLAGRSWRVEHLDRRRRVAHVTPSGERGKTRWVGQGPAVPRTLAEGMRRVLTGELDVGAFLSKRAAPALNELREELEPVCEPPLVLERTGWGRQRLWTFGGTTNNRALARAARPLVNHPVDADDLFIEFRGDPEAGADPSFEAALRRLRAGVSIVVPPEDDEPTMKFAEALPASHRQALTVARQAEEGWLGAVLASGWARFAASSNMGREHSDGLPPPVA